VGLLDVAEIEDLKNRQAVIADLLEARPYADDFWSELPGYPKRDPTSVEFARFRHPLAMAYMSDELKLPLGIRIDKDGSPIYVTDRVDDGPSIPGELFGVPLRSERSVGTIYGSSPRT
jgi:hypothetical protein